jgi:hypothetical protein
MSFEDFIRNFNHLSICRPICTSEHLLLPKKPNFWHSHVWYGEWSLGVSAGGVSGEQK